MYSCRRLQLCITDGLKAAPSDGPCRSRAFPIWQAPDRLVDELTGLIGDWLPCRVVAITMTAELVDCFATKAEGVTRIPVLYTHLRAHQIRHDPVCRLLLEKKNINYFIPNY